jgi:hypothetical protein
MVHVIWRIEPSHLALASSPASESISIGQIVPPQIACCVADGRQPALRCISCQGGGIIED